MGQQIHPPHGAFGCAQKIAPCADIGLMSRDSFQGIDATKKLPGEGFKRPWPPLICMDENVRKKIDSLLSGE